MHVVPLDVTDREATVAAGAAVREALGGLDAAVLNAGTWSRFRPEDWDSSAFADQLQTNLMGTVHALEAVVPTMLADGRGRIVGTASVAGYRGIPGAEAYGATKAALLNLFESLRGSLGPRGIVVQTVAFMVSPEEAARAIADGMAKDKAEIVFPLAMMLLMKAVRLVPVRAWTAATAAMTRRGMRRERR
jgi:short-subunit dehydrogenase